MAKREAFQWVCPFCGKHASIVGQDHSVGSAVIISPGPAGNMALQAAATTCPNPTCRKFQLRAWLFKAKLNPFNQLIETTGTALQAWQLIPDSAAIPLPDYVPLQIRGDYVEASRIVNLSPKAAATLARRCLQGMIGDVWGVRKKNLAKAIEAIKSKVEPEAWKAINGVRTIGNIGAHMEKDVNLIVPVEPGEAQTLLRLIEALVEDWYVKPRERAALYAKVSRTADEKAAARKATKSKPPEAEAGESKTTADEPPQAAHSGVVAQGKVPP